MIHVLGLALALWDIQRIFSLSVSVSLSLSLSLSPLYALYGCVYLSLSRDLSDGEKGEGAG